MGKANWRFFDFWLLGAVALLTIFGIMMINSSIAGNIEFTQDTPLVQRQLIFALAGFSVVFIVAAVDYRLWAAISRPLYWVAFLGLAALDIAGQALFGSARWFDTGVILIQPSELVKIIMILVLADFFTRHQEKIINILWIGRSLLYTLGLVAWVFIQPNLSTSLVMMVLWFALLWAAGLKINYLLVFLLVGIILPFVAFPLLEPYQQGRILNFLSPDPEASYGETYNIQQALISIGSGGLLGQGYGQSTQVQLRFLKVRWSDFIFSVTAAELGFVGVLVMMGVIAFVIFRCLRAARIARDTYGALIAYGMAALLAFQTFVNIGVNLRMLPATGLTLPFVSYGGSSLLSLLVGIGLVESIVLHHKTMDF